VREALAHIRADYPESEVVVIANHIWDSYQCYFTGRRRLFCSVSGTPTYFADVMHKHIGGGGTWNSHYNTMVGWITTQAAKTAPCTIALDATRFHDTINVETTVELDSNISGNHAVWVLVYQGTVGSYKLVPRAGDYRHLLTISSSGESETFDWDFELDSSWDENDLYLVAYVGKTDGNKEVDQATMQYLDLGTINVEETTWGQIKALEE